MTTCTRIEAEEIHKNFEYYMKIASYIKDPVRNREVVKFIEKYGEKICLAPDTTNINYGHAYPGGLVKNCLQIFDQMHYLNKNLKQFTSLEKPVSQDSIIIVSLLHSIGKIGDMNTDYYIDQKSTWHNEKLGEYYLINTSNIEFMSIQMRSLFLLHSNGVPLQEDEYTTIYLSNKNNKEIEYYSGHENNLIILMRIAKDLLHLKSTTYLST